MNTLFKIASFPITLIIEIICFLFVLAFEFELIKDAQARGASRQVAFLRILKETDNLMLMELWKGIYPIFRCAIALGTYYYFFG